MRPACYLFGGIIYQLGGCYLKKRDFFLGISYELKIQFCVCDIPAWRVLSKEERFFLDLI